MAIKVQTDITKMNPGRQMQDMQGQIAKEIAAEQAVSEHMRHQIQELSGMREKAMEAGELLETVEGMTVEILSMLSRMKELAERVAMRNVTEEECRYLQEESHQLQDEIDRIATQGLQKLKAYTSEDGKIVTIPIGDRENQSISFALLDMRAESLGVSGTKSNVLTPESAKAAMKYFDFAIEQVAGQKKLLNAACNRLAQV